MDHRFVQLQRKDLKGAGVHVVLFYDIRQKPSMSLTVHNIGDDWCLPQNSYTDDQKGELTAKN